MVSRDNKKIRMGMLCFVIYGIMAAAGLPFRGPVVIPGENPGLWAEVALLPTHDLAWAILLPALVIQLFGFFAYLTYNATNLSVMKGYDALVAVVDTGWGTLVGAGVAGATVAIMLALGRG